MIEAIFDKAVDYLFPHFCSQILEIMREVHEKQNPPYSKGMLMMEIHRAFRAKKLTNKYLFYSLSEPVLANMGRYDYIYCD